MMWNRRGWLSLLVAGLIGATAARADDTDANQQAAIAAAESWLKLTDSNAYGDAWEAASEYLKEAVTKEAFEQALTGVRKPLGEVKSRKLTRATYKTSLPGAPDGEYYVIQFDTSMAHKEAAAETITPTKTESGAWKVSGYYIK